MLSLKCLNNEIIELLHKNSLLKPLVKTEVIKSKIECININEDEKNKYLKELDQKLQINSIEERNIWIKNNNFNGNDFENLALVPARLKVYAKSNFSHKIKTRFLERKNQLDSVLYSLIRVSNYEMAREIYLQAKEDEEIFGDLAEKYSEGHERDTRGFVGPSNLERTNPVLAEHLRNSQPGIIQPPIRVLNSYAVIRVEYFQPAKLNELMCNKMEEELFKISMDDETDNLSNKLLSKIQTKNDEIIQ